jgi:hypothetical protein
MEFLQGRPYKRFNSPTRSILSAKKSPSPNLAHSFPLAEKVHREFKRVDERCAEIKRIAAFSGAAEPQEPDVI